MAAHLPKNGLTFGPKDRDNPREWSNRKKSLIGYFVLYSAFVATLGTPIYIAAIPKVAADFRLTTMLTIAPSTYYPLGIAFGALFGTGASEILGRPAVYRASIPLSLIFLIIGGLAQNYTLLSVSRAFSGFFAGPCLTVGIGVINDIWDVSLQKIGTAFGIVFVLFSVWAAELGPMISAALIVHQTWRWTFWLHTILTTGMMAASALLPETFEPQILRERVQQNKSSIHDSESTMKLLFRATGRPLHMLVVEPIICPMGLIIAITQAVVFSYYIAYAVLFEEIYHFSQYQVGLAFGPLAIGSLLAVPVVAAFDKLKYQPARARAVKSGGKVSPEKRLYAAMLGGVLLPISLFWLAWTGRPGTPAIVPLISGGMFGLSYVINMLCLPLYLNDVYTHQYGASVLAAATFLRFLISSTFPLFTNQMISKLGFEWAVSVLAFISRVLIPIPWIFMRFGPAMRARSQYLRLIESKALGSGSASSEGSQ